MLGFVTTKNEEVERNVACHLFEIGTTLASKLLLFIFVFTGVHDFGRKSLCLFSM